MLAALSLIILCGCSRPEVPPPAPVVVAPVKITPTNQQTLLPFGEGNTWVYDAEISSSDGDKVVGRDEGEIVFKMSDVKKVGNKTQAFLTATKGDELLGVSTWSVSDDGIEQSAGGMKNVPFSSPEPIVKFPIEKNSILTWSNSGEMPDGMQGAETGVTKVVRAPQIDTAISTVSGIASTAVAKFVSKNNEGVETTTTWFQPGVGMVRIVQTTRIGDRTNATTIRLKSWEVQHS